MIREDFLLRLIQQLAEVIGRAMGLARKGRTEEAERALDEATNTHVGMPRAMLNKLAPEELARVLGPEKCMVVAALLDAEADIAKLTADEGRAAVLIARANAIRIAAGLPVKG
jgi:hypothetical protein